jgi:hypothetical protein
MGAGPTVPRLFVVDSRKPGAIRAGDSKFSLSLLGFAIATRDYQTELCPTKRRGLIGLDLVDLGGRKSGAAVAGFRAAERRV